VRHFHLIVQAMSPRIEASVPLVLDGHSYPTLQIPAAHQAETLGVTFEQAFAQLEQLERMYIEPDGSFVWVSSDEAEAATWQVDGLLHDRGDGLVGIELKGCCPRFAFEKLLFVCGWPTTALSFQLVREAVFFDERTIRQFLFSQLSAS
jgi:hypothetical protein